MGVKHFVYQLKRVKLKEIVQIWKLPVSLLCMPFYRAKYKNLWIVCEDANEARDNGFWFFKYVREYHPEQKCVYAIKSSSPDYHKVSSIGKTVEYGSLKHWILYLVSRKKISSQKAGNPNAAIFYYLEVYGLLKNKRIFLQHGVIKDNLTWLYYDVTKMTRFICGAYPEYEFVSSRFGYPEGYVKYTGLCRFDGLHDFKSNERLVLIMPTWREWIADEDTRLEKFEGTRDIVKSNYFKCWNGFINDARIEEIAKKYNVRFLFFPHRNMQKYMSIFPKSNEYIEIADGGKYDVQDLLKRASMMVTDYSSVFFDMIYMKKPVVFYQFDYEMFRKAQYEEGYFDYKNNPFGKSFVDRSDTFDYIERIIKEGFKVSKTFLNEHHNYFPKYDTDNCQRVYSVTTEL